MDLECHWLETFLHSGKIYNHFKTKVRINIIDLLFSSNFFIKSLFSFLNAINNTKPVTNKPPYTRNIMIFINSSYIFRKRIFFTPNQLICIENTYQKIENGTLFFFGHMNFTILPLLTKVELLKRFF